ncbi:hypothetical protein FF1_009304 [Malus domestica]
MTLSCSPRLAAYVAELCQAVIPQARAKGSRFENPKTSTSSIASPPLQVGLQSILAHGSTFLTACSSSPTTIDQDSFESHLNF